MPDGAPQPGGGGFGYKPPQSETGVAGEAKDWRLVKRQVKTLCVWGNLIYVLLLFLVLLFCVKADHRGLGRWLLEWWPTLFVVPVLWTCYALSMGSYRMAAEIVDPSYPTPRTSVPPELQRDGPRWPGAKPTNQVAVKPQPPLKPTRFELDMTTRRTHGSKTVMAQFPNTLAMANFAEALAGGAPLNEASARGFGVKGEYENVRKVLMNNGWAAWKDPDHHQQGLKLIGDGATALRGVATGIRHGLGVRSPVRASSVRSECPSPTEVANDSGG